MENKGRTIKNKFILFFDGCYGIDSVENDLNTFTMGVCKLDYNENDNILTVYLRRPGLLIGKAGTTIDAIQKFLNCKIYIKEVSLLK